jgi:hypothetical protein
LGRGDEGATESRGEGHAPRGEARGAPATSARAGGRRADADADADADGRVRAGDQRRPATTSAPDDDRLAACRA